MLRELRERTRPNPLRQLPRRKERKKKKVVLPALYLKFEGVINVMNFR